MQTHALRMNKDLVYSCLLTFQEWADYDEHSNQSVGIYELEHQFVKV